jgi:hypothetical protein
MKKKFQWWQVTAPLEFPNDADYQWCLDIMGKPDYTARWWYESSSKNFYFRQKKDAMWFELMWSGHDKTVTAI